MNDHITIILEFLNTLNLTTGLDMLADPSQLLEWLRRRVSDSEQTPSIQDIAWATEFREALRDLVSGNSGRTPSAAAVEIVDRAARAAPLGLHFHQGGSATLDPFGSSLEGAGASVLIAMRAAMAAGTWSRIKICRNPACLWAFYDRSKNRSGVWCEMAACGNRMKARRFRRRRREPQASSRSSSLCRSSSE